MFNSCSILPMWLCEYFVCSSLHYLQLLPPFHSSNRNNTIINKKRGKSKWFNTINNIHSPTHDLKWEEWNCNGNSYQKQQLTLDVPTLSITFLLLYITKHTLFQITFVTTAQCTYISPFHKHTACNSYRLPLQTRPNLKFTSFSLFIPQGSTKTTQVQAYLHTVTLIGHAWSICIWICWIVTWTNHSWTCCQH